MPTIRTSRAFEREQELVNLISTLGGTQNEIDRIITDGFVSMKDLVIHHEHDLETFRTYLKTLNKTFNQHSDPTQVLYFPPMLTSRLMGALFYCKTCYYDFHVIPDIRNINKSMASELYKVYGNMKDNDKSDLDKDIETKIPSLKGASNWRSFRDLVIMKLAQIKGKAGYPVIYVIDDTPRAAKRKSDPRLEADEVDLSEDDIFETRPVQFGTTFKDDNRRVWNVIKSLLLETPSYDHIIGCNRTADGKKAWKILQTFYEGEDFKQRLQDEAFVLLNNSIYKGNSNRHTFESYVNRHIKAHKLLMEAEYNNRIGMDDSTKIQHLKSGIKFEAGLEHAITTARTMGLLRGNFTNFVAFLQAEVDQKNSRKKELQGSFKVSGLKQGRRNDKAKNLRNNKRRRLTEMVDGKLIEAKSYPMKEWKLLTPAQRTAVKRLNKKLKGDNMRNEEINISSIDTSSVSQETISSISEAVIASIQRQNKPQNDNTSNNGGQNSNDSESQTKATSGRVGQFLSRSRN